MAKRSKHNGELRIFLCGGLLLSQLAYCDIVTDGTVGAVQRLTGSTMEITESLGTRAGNNLFHSFERFSIASGESATFTGANDIQRVISRVTGKEASHINGILSSQVGKADFYFINPNGVVIGEGAQIDVPASLFISTADSLRFNDGSVYNTDLSKPSTLSLVEPQAFGFVGGTSASVNVNNVDLSTAVGSRIQLVAQDVGLEQSHLVAEAGEIKLVSVGEAEVDMAINAENELHQGDIALVDSLIDVSGVGAGRIDITAGAFNAIDSRVKSDNLSDEAVDISTAIAVNAESMNLDRTTLNVSTVTDGIGAAIAIVIDGDLELNNDSEILVRNKDLSIAVAGDFEINDSNIWSYNDLLIVASGFELNGSNIWSRIDSSIVAGDLEINDSTIWADGTIHMDIKDELLIHNALAEGKVSSQLNSISAKSLLQLNAGSLSVQNASIMANELDLLIGKQVDLSNGVIRNGGDGTTRIFAESLLINGEGSKTAGIFGEPEPVGTSEGGGNYSIKVDRLELINGARIEKEGQGNIKIDVGSLLIDGEGVETGIFGKPDQIWWIQAEGGAETIRFAGGSISILVDKQLELISGAMIKNDGEGSINIIAESLVIDGEGVETGIFGEPNGDISILIDKQLEMLNGAAISASTILNANAGNILIIAGDLLMNGNGASASITSESRSTYSFEFFVELARIFGKGVFDVSVVDEGIVITGALSGPMTVEQFNRMLAGLGIGYMEEAEIREQLDFLGLPWPTSAAEFDILLHGLGLSGPRTVDQFEAFLDGLGLKDLAIQTLGISFPSDEAGVAGNVTILVNDSLNILGDSFISASSNSLSDAGNVHIDAGRIVIDGNSDHPSISTESENEGDAGSVSVNATIDFLAIETSISTTAAEGNGGKITLEAPLINLNNSFVTTSVSGQGDGGDIFTSGSALVLNGGVIQANTSGAGSIGGKITISNDTLFAYGNSLQIGNNTQGRSASLNIIQAAAPDGENGMITVRAPYIYHTDDRANLEGQLLDLDMLNQSPCTTSGQSSLVSLGRGALPVTPDTLGVVDLRQLDIAILLKDGEASVTKATMKDTPWISAAVITEDNAKGVVKKSGIMRDCLSI